MYASACRSSFFFFSFKPARERSPAIYSATRSSPILPSTGQVATKNRQKSRCKNLTHWNYAKITSEDILFLFFTSFFFRARRVDRILPPTSDLPRSQPRRSRCDSPCSMAKLLIIYVPYNSPLERGSACEIDRARSTFRRRRPRVRRDRDDREKSGRLRRRRENATARTGKHMSS